MNKIPTYNFLDLGREEKLVDLFIWNQPEPYQIDKPHCHAYHEIMIFFKGDGIHEIDFKSFETKDYSFHIIPQNFIHKLNRKALSSGFTIALSPVFVEQLCKFDPTTNYYSLFEHDHVIQLSKKEFLEFQFYLTEILKPDSTGAFVQNICSAILLKLIPFVANKTSYSNFTNKIRKAVEDNFDKRLSTAQYAEILKVSPTYLNTQLKNATGKTIMKLQDELLISKVKRLLYSTETSLKEIAFDFGFKDYAHFSKFFKNLSGYAPAKYRNLLKKIQEVDKN